MTTTRNAALLDFMAREGLTVDDVLTALGLVDWPDIRGALARHRLSVQDVADTLGIKYSRFSTILNADDETMPRPAFADRVMDAIEQLAAERARGQ